MNTCKCYEKIDSINGICNGTREREYCTCKGNESDCDFYEEKRGKKSKEMTNREWLNSLSTEDFVAWLMSDYPVEVNISGYPTIKVNIGLNTLFTSAYENRYDKLNEWMNASFVDRKITY